MKIVIYQQMSDRGFDMYQTVFAELVAQCGSHFPIEFEAADSTEANFLDGWLEGRHDEDPLLYLFESSLGPNGEDLATRYVIDIDGVSSDLKNKFKEYANLPHAEWGFCHSSFLVVNYAPHSSSILNLVHESLHLFGVGDCYDELSLQPKSNCNNSNCVMRYGQKPVSLEICDSVREQVVSFYE
ncbi:MAG: hypothetical protein ISP76_05225 [Burkholderiales bacterium]|nr:hypothetical protein [Burkholderiales bacterium]